MKGRNRPREFQWHWVGSGLESVGAVFSSSRRLLVLLLLGRLRDTGSTSEAIFSMMAVMLVYVYVYVHNMHTFICIEEHTMVK